MKLSEEATQILATLLDLPKSQRVAYLDQICADNSQLRNEIESLLVFESQAQEFRENNFWADIGALIPSPTSDKGETVWADDALIGRKLGEFTLQSILAKGGFGTVYRAEQPSLARTVAIKVLKLEHQSQPALIERFKREAELASHLEHPYLAHIYGFGVEADGLMWLAMELVTGQSLQLFLKEHGPLPFSQALALVEKICQVVATAHEQGVIHRDIKPANIMVVSHAGELLPKLLDFGIAKILTAHSSPDYQPTIFYNQEVDPTQVTVEAIYQHSQLLTTQNGMIIGSPHYMSPEQWQGHANIDARSDIYALGVLTYQMITGRLPFEGTLLELKQAHLFKTPPILFEDLPTTLAEVIAQAMAKDPQDRYKSALLYAEALRAASNISAEPLTNKTQSPYPGLSAYSLANAEHFFGRTQDIKECLARIMGEPCLAIVGPSGAGKSSFLQAGIATALIKQWQVIILRPSDLPLINLQTALIKFNLDLKYIANLLITNIEQTAKLLRDYLTQTNQKLLLIVDQFEEIFTVCVDQIQRDKFAIALTQFAYLTNDKVRVVIGLRDDFLMRTQQLPELGRQLTQGKIYLLNTPGATEIKEIITKPIAKLGYHCEDQELLQQLIESITKQTIQLPLLTFALAKLWELRDQQLKILTRSAYQAIGGIEGALAQHAETLFTQLTVAEQLLTKRIFRHLITTAGTKISLTKLEFIQVLNDAIIAENILERLIRARLLIIYQSTNNSKVVDKIEIIHESLVNAWPRLKQWLTEDQEFIRIREQLRIAAQQWEQRNQAKTLLWQGELLLEYKVWRIKYPDRLTDLEEAFGSASITQQNYHQRNQQRIIAGIIAVLTILLLVLFWQRQEAIKNAEMAKENAIKANMAAKQIEVQNLQLAQQNQALIESLQQQKYFSEQANSNAQLAQIEKTHAENSLQEAQYQAALAKINALAEKEASNQSTQRLLTLYEEEGRQELLQGRPLRAALYFNKEYLIAEQHQSITPTLKYLLAQSMQAIDIQQFSLDAHRSSLSIAKFSPNGKYIATASYDNTAKIWDASSGQLITSLDPHKSWLTEVNFSNNSEMIITSSADGTAKVWHINGDLIHSLNYHTSNISAAAFSANNRYIVTASFDGTAAIWQVDTGELITVLSNHKGRINFATFSPNNLYIVTTGLDDNSAKVWDVNTGKLLFNLLGHKDGVYQACFSSDNLKLVTASWDNSAIVWDLRTGQAITHLEGHTDWLSSAIFSPDNRQILTASRDGTAKLWNAYTGQGILSLTGHLASISTAYFNFNGSQIVTASYDKTAKLWDSVDGHLIATLEGHTGALVSAIFSPDGKQIVTASLDKSAKLWHLDKQDKIVVLKNNPKQIKTAQFSLDTKLLLTTSNYEKIVKIYNSQTGSLVSFIEDGKQRVNFAQLSPNNRTLVTINNNGIAKLWDINSGLLITTFNNHTSQILLVKYSYNGDYIVSVDNKNTINLWNANNGKLIDSIVNNVQTLYLNFSYDNAKLAIISVDKTIKLWDLLKHHYITTLIANDSYIYTRFSPNNQYLVATNGATSQVWELTNYRSQILLQQTDKVTNRGGIDLLDKLALFSPNSSLLITTASDNTAKVWQVATGKLLSVLDAHTDIINQTLFNLDSNLIITMAADNTIKIWDISTGKLLSSFKQNSSIVALAGNNRSDNLIYLTADNRLKNLAISLENRSSLQIDSLIKQKIPYYLNSDGRIIPIKLASGR